MVSENSEQQSARRFSNMFPSILSALLFDSILNWSCLATSIRLGELHSRKITCLQIVLSRLPPFVWSVDSHALQFHSFNLTSMDVWLSFVIKIKDIMRRERARRKRDENWKPIIKKAAIAHSLARWALFLHNLIARKIYFRFLTGERHNSLLYTPLCGGLSLASARRSLINVFNFSRTSLSSLTMLLVDMMSCTLAKAQAEEFQLFLMRFYLRRFSSCKDWMTHFLCELTRSMSCHK